MNDLLCIRRLSKHYDGFDLSDVDIDVPGGSVVGLIGSNGAGKTTTIKAALGLIRPDGGDIELFGQDASAAAAGLHQRIGVVFDACSFPAPITVADAGKMMKRAYTSWKEDAFSTLVRQFELDPGKKVSDLSRGMGMKLSLACALSHDADLLVLDEATAGLDPLARDEALDILRGFMADERRGILMSSHITSDLEKIADYIVCIDNGRIAFSVEKDTITDQAGIAQCRSDEFEIIRESGFFAPGGMRFVRHTYGFSVLVPDRIAFSQRFASTALDKATIDDYMQLMLKGDAA